MGAGKVRFSAMELLCQVYKKEGDLIMPGTKCKKKLPDKPGGKVPGRGRVTKIRTIKPKAGKYIHVRVMSKKGPRGGKTIAGGVQTKKKK
jgi:hypothetical protein